MTLYLDCDARSDILSEIFSSRFMNSTAPGDPFYSGRGCASSRSSGVHHDVQVVYMEMPDQEDQIDHCEIPMIYVIPVQVDPRLKWTTEWRCSDFVDIWMENLDWDD